MNRLITALALLALVVTDALGQMKRNTSVEAEAIRRRAPCGSLVNERIGLC